MEDRTFVELLEKHRHEFFCFVKRNVWNEADAEDAFCAAVMAAYKNRKAFCPQTNFRAWMYKILVNKCFTANRKTRLGAVDIDTVDEQYLARDSDVYVGMVQDPDRLIHECGDEVLRALSRLRTVERSCLLLLSLGNYSYQEIAEITEIPVATVMTHLARGRAKLRKWLCDYASKCGLARRAATPASDQRLGAKGGRDA